MLVGGFGQSNYLYNRLKTRFNPAVPNPPPYSERPEHAHGAIEVMQPVYAYFSLPLIRLALYILIAEQLDSSSTWSSAPGIGRLNGGKSTGPVPLRNILRNCVGGGQAPI